MKFFLLLALSLFYIHDTHAQKRKTFRISPGEKLVDKIPTADLYTYPEFASGVVFFRNNTFSPATLNYNELFDEMQFIDPKGDTLSLDEEKLISSIVIGKDTFYYGDCYLRQLANAGEVKLGRKSFFVFLNRQKLSGFGEASGGNIETFTSISSKTYLKELVAREILTLGKDKSMYIGDKYNNFKILNKKNLLEMYATREKEVQTYLKENKVSFANEEDMKKLLEHFKTPLQKG